MLKRFYLCPRCIHGRPGIMSWQTFRCPDRYPIMKPLIQPEGEASVCAEYKPRPGPKERQL